MTTHKEYDSLVETNVDKFLRALNARAQDGWRLVHLETDGSWFALLERDAVRAAPLPKPPREERTSPLMSCSYDNHYRLKQPMMVELPSGCYEGTWSGSRVVHELACTCDLYEFTTEKRLRRSRPCTFEVYNGLVENLVTVEEPHG